MKVDILLRKDQVNTKEDNKDVQLLKDNSRGHNNERKQNKGRRRLSQISYSLVVILELSGVLEVQYKEIMMSSINKDN